MAASALELLFKIRSDSSDARKDIAGLRGLVSKELRGIGSDFAGVVPGIGRFAGALGPVGIGLVATAGAAIGAGVAIFGLAKSAASAGNDLLALSTRTGVSVETLSSFRLVALQSNTSLEQLAVGLNFFNRQIGQAAEGSKEATSALKRFGVEPKAALADSEEALEKVFKRINELPPGIQRAVAAQQAFGKSGAGLVQAIQAVGGNLDEFMKKARRSSQVSLEAAQAGDRFDSSLTELNFSIAEVARQIGQVFVPVITDGMKSVSAAVAANASTWAGWAGAAIDSIRNVADAWRLYQAVMSGNIMTGVDAGMAVAGERIDRARVAKLMADPDLAQERARMSAVTAGKKQTGVSDFFAPKGGGAKKGGGGGKAAVVDSNQLEITRRETERFYREQEEIVNRSYERQLKTIEEFTDEQVTLEERRAASMRALLIEERAALTEKGEARKNKERTINEEIAALAEQSQRTILQIRDKGAEEAEKIERARREKEETVFSEMDEAVISSIQIAIANRLKVESEAEQEITDVRVAAINRRVEAMETEREKFHEDSVDYLKIQGEIAAAEVERTRVEEEGAQRRIDARRRETEDAMQQGIFKREAEIQSEREDPSSGRSIFGDVFGDATNEGASNMEAFGDTVRSVLGSISASAGNARTMMLDLFGSIAQGVGAGIKSFILLGNFGAGGLRKFAAEAIASVAAQAAVKAIFEVAEGFAALARFDPVSAAAHFSAAKFYGVIAGVAAVAGRAIAGSAFANDAKPSPVGAGSGGTNQPSRPEDRTVRESRSGSSQQVIIIRLESGLVGEKVRDEIANNGPLRGLILETAKG